MLVDDMLVPDIVAHPDAGNDAPTPLGNDIFILPLLSSASVVFTTNVYDVARLTSVFVGTTVNVRLLATAWTVAEPCCLTKPF